MQNRFASLFAAIVLFAAAALAVARPALALPPPLSSPIGGFNLTEDGTNFVYDASFEAGRLLPAQERVLAAKGLGASHIILNVRATMVGGRGNEVTPMTPPAARGDEARRLVRLMRYIRAQGMTVGLRPLVFVVGPRGEFPYVETRPDGSKKSWWHGNIQPSDPDRWFESFRVYLDQYALIAKLGKADDFTLGAELYSMTVGIEDQWKEYPYGFPGRWLELLRYFRGKLPDARLAYDINFTDDAVASGGLRKAGGEIERWRYRLVDLAGAIEPAQKQIWQDLVAFWTELDAIGIDMYRSLASERDALSPQLEPLAAELKARADSYASQLDTILTEIAVYVGVDKAIVLKEVGFRSVDKGYIDPFTYSGAGAYNEVHQAAAYSALFAAFWAPKWPWFKGICFWDIAIDPAKSGPGDVGFSPLGKPLTEAQIRAYFGAPKDR
jgi:hypothetical protein